MSDTSDYGPHPEARWDTDPAYGPNPVVRKLYATTDAQVWAQEWCRIAREIEEDGRGQVIDEGWMIGWFANAMCVAFDHHEAAVREAATS